ncbi:hypothetical protein GCM10009745_78790 [Kribbella yunnanensis]|uniref:Uncharacterized protein n=1 Tax=Kribbella yunnanensis TaxID=190194 RepID=A0ABN2J5S2_9ACTN
MVGTWQGWIVLAAGSGVSAGLANQLLSWLRDHLQRSFQRDQYLLDLQHQRSILLDQRRHEAQLRAEQAHYDARSVHLPLAQSIHAWLYNEWALRFGNEVAYTPKAISPVVLQGPSDVLTQVGELAVAHPTRRVRELARALDSEIETCYNFAAPHRAGEPSREQLEAWIAASSRLIEAIHEFPLELIETGDAPQQLSLDA